MGDFLVWLAERESEIMREVYRNICVAIKSQQRGVLSQSRLSVIFRQLNFHICFEHV